MGQAGRGTGRLRSIGPYTLLDRVGVGGMGVVYRALDRRSGTVVAFKLLHEHVALDPAAIERFRREAHVASLLRSSYAVHALDFGREDGQYYFVSEFVEGRSLSEVMAEGRAEPLAALAIVSQVALALDEAESRQITHRDVKPENIMLSEDGSVKLADFGIASLQYFAGPTVAGNFVGTLAYSAPEQHHGAADVRSDLYSLGVVLFELLAGRKPFEASTPAHLMALHADSAPPLEQLGEIPDELVEVVRRCLAKDPADRYQHVSEFLATLDAVRATLGSEGLQVSPVESFIAGTDTPIATQSPAAPGDDLTRELPPMLPTRSAAVAGSEAIGTAVPPILASLPEAGHGDRRRWPLILAGVAGLVLLVAIAAFAAYNMGSGDGEKSADSGPPPAGGTATSVAGSGGSTPQSLGSANVTTPTTAPGTTATQPPGQQPTAQVTQPPPTATSVPSTATLAPPTYSVPVFATNLSDNGLAPAGAVASGGTLGSCPIRELWAYVTHANVPVGTQLTGAWTFQGTFQANNPTFATDATNSTTNYSFVNPQGLPQGTYGFTLRAGLTQVAAGTVTISC